MAVRRAASSGSFPGFGSSDLVAVEQHGVIAELRDLPGDAPVGGRAIAAGEQDDDEPLALGRGKFLLRSCRRDGGPENPQAEDHGRDAG
jgi:hypothetical protein